MDFVCVSVPLAFHAIGTFTIRESRRTFWLISSGFCEAEGQMLLNFNEVFAHIAIAKYQHLQTDIAECVHFHERCSPIHPSIALK